MIDTHAHLYQAQFDGDRPEVIERALKQGVEKILLPNIDATTIDAMLALVAQYPGICYPMIGLHPCSVKEDFEEQLALVEKWINQEEFIAVGEMGTDLYWDKTFWEEQKKAFHFQCELALKYDLPIVVHCRESMDETIQLLSGFVDKGLRGVFHCFTGSAKQARELTTRGFYIGLGGVCTFKNSGLDTVIPQIDRTKIILETDSPYLAPTPHRGKRNEPSFMPLIAKKIAESLELTVNELDKLTTSNVNELFFTKRQKS